MSNIELGLGCLCAVAQGYNYMCNTIKFELFSNEFHELGSNIELGLVGCTQWCKVIITVEQILKCLVIFKGSAGVGE